MAKGKSAQGAAAALETALQETPLWTEKAEYIFRHGYALADLDQELALKIVQTYFFEDIRLSARPEVIALFARLQAGKKRRGYRDFVKELSPTDRFTSVLHNIGLAQIALGAPQVALQNLSAAARLLPVNFTILEDIKSAYEILKDDERSAQLQEYWSI